VLSATSAARPPSLIEAECAWTERGAPGLTGAQMVVISVTGFRLVNVAAGMVSDCRACWKSRHSLSWDNASVMRP
jgi:hypothetical protein